MSSSTRRSGVLVALVATVVVAACGSTNPSQPPTTTGPEATASTTPAPSSPAAPSDAPSPSSSAEASVCDDSVTGGPASTPGTDDPDAATYEEIEAQVEELRGLSSETEVARGVFDTPGLCAYLREGFREDNPEELIVGTELLYRELGLIPEDASLEQLFLELLTSQVAGLYDDDTKHMYVVSKSGEVGPVEEVTYAHEYTHALQDQAFVLKDVVGEATDQSDRSLARSSVIEGDATLLMSLWAQRHLTSGELGEVANSVDPASQAIVDAMPPILKDPLEFPYVSGLNLTLRAFSAGGFAAVDELYANPPDSTEQVLHPEKLDAREQPVAVAFADDLATRLGEGWAVSLQDTFGELLLEVVLRDAGASGTGDAAAGWGGDRVALIEGPGDEVAVVLDTAWDSQDDAVEFETALGPTVAELEEMGRSVRVLRPGPDRVVLVSAESADTLGLVANVLGLAG